MQASYIEVPSSVIFICSESVVRGGGKKWMFQTAKMPGESEASSLLTTQASSLMFLSLAS